MSDWTTDPAELPEDGERYDMTLDKIGLTKIGPKDNKREAVVVKCVIDNGEYEGKKVSHLFELDDAGFTHKIHALIGTWTDQFLPQGIDSMEDWILALRTAFEKQARFSAVVRLREFEDDSKRGVKYRLSDFEPPQEEAELHLRTEPTQFKRNL